jgi:PAS domain S-box-containing protein
MSVLNVEKGEAYYRNILKSIKDYAVFATDKDGIITSWNPGAQNILLYKADEIIGKSGNILYVPEDIDARVPEIELATALQDGRAINERFHVKKDQSRFWGSGLVFPLLDEQGNHIGFTKVMRNVSDEEQAEINLREEQTLAQTLVSAFNEPIVVLNSDLKIVNFTSAFVQYFSLNKTSITGKDFYEIMDGGVNIEQLRSKLEEALKNDNFYADFEVAYIHIQRGARSVRVRPRRIYQPPNLLFSLEFEDLTENKAVMEEKDVFISVASHEIRTPISVIKAYGQILARELKDAKPIVTKAVVKINEQINYMNSLITTLLDTSKITTGKLEIKREVFDLCNLIKEIIEGFRLTQTSHSIEFTQKKDSLVSADRVHTSSVITNLLSNAVKYSPNADKVHVNLDIIDHWVKVNIRDYGMGIPEIEQDKLFQRFGRTESIKKTKIPGTGLGLHLSAEIIKLQGGEIGFTTEVGKGSTFYFTLPLYEGGV